MTLSWRVSVTPQPLPPARLKVNAGHGLTYHNVLPIAALPEMHELNIGHAIIGRAVMSGLPDAVKEMKQLLREARR